MVDHDVDIVFIEYVLNDGFDNTILDSRVGKIYERLVRKILAKPNMPAVVMMQVGLGLGLGLARDGAGVGGRCLGQVLSEHAGLMLGAVHLPTDVESSAPTY